MPKIWKNNKSTEDQPKLSCFYKNKKCIKDKHAQTSNVIDSPQHGF